MGWDGWLMGTRWEGQVLLQDPASRGERRIKL